jgi:ABC-2 type transport system permease protein
MPLVISSLLIMLIMRFSPAARNKDRFTLAASIFAILLGLSLSFGMQSLISKSESVDFAQILSQSADKISRISSGVFPGTYFVNYVLVKPEGWDSLAMMLAFIGITALSFLLLYAVGNLVYFKGVIGISGSGSKGKKLSKSEFDESTASGSAFITYVKKDLLVLVRTPIFFMNNVLVSVLLPLIMFIPLLTGVTDNSGIQLSALREMAQTTLFTGDFKIAGFILVGFFAFITFTCGTNGISESAISREGNCAYLMKIIPMSYRSQIWAKISAGIVVSLVGALLILGILIVVVLPPFWFVLLCIAVIPGAILLPNITGIIFDLYMPKIRWDNEQKAVKQNMNVLYGIFFSTMVIGLMVASVVTIPFPFAGAAAFIVCVPLLFSGLSALIVNKVLNKTMLQLAA